MEIRKKKVNATYDEQDENVEKKTLHHNLFSRLNKRDWLSTKCVRDMSDLLVRFQIKFTSSWWGFGLDAFGSFWIRIGDRLKLELTTFFRWELDFDWNLINLLRKAHIYIHNDYLLTHLNLYIKYKFKAHFKIE